MHKRNRCLLAQFRLGILPLHIETGRFVNTPLENRICNLCNLNEIENEYHFIMVCPLYAEYRTVLFSKASVIIDNFVNSDDNTKFMLMLQRCQKYVSNFICSAYQIRKSKLFQ